MGKIREEKKERRKRKKKNGNNFKREKSWGRREKSKGRGGEAWVKSFKRGGKLCREENIRKGKKFCKERGVTEGGGRRGSNQKQLWAFKILLGTKGPRFGRRKQRGLKGGKTRGQVTGEICLDKTIGTKRGDIPSIPSKQVGKR